MTDHHDKAPFGDGREELPAAELSYPVVFSNSDGLTLRAMINFSVEQPLILKFSFYPAKPGEAHTASNEVEWILPLDAIVRTAHNANSVAQEPLHMTFETYVEEDSFVLRLTGDVERDGVFVRETHTYMMPLSTMRDVVANIELMMPSEEVQNHMIRQELERFLNETRLD